MALPTGEISDLASVLDAEYRALLELVRVELENSENHPYIELLDRVPGDIGDQSVADQLADFDLAIIDRHIAELRDIEAARARMRDGSYGVCMECGDTIAIARLKVYPTAKRCVRCQQQRERTYVHSPTPTL